MVWSEFYFFIESGYNFANLQKKSEISAIIFLVRIKPKEK